METWIKVDELRPLVKSLNDSEITYGKAIELITDICRYNVEMSKNKQHDFTWINIKDHLPEFDKMILLYTARDFKSDDKIIKGWFSQRDQCFCSTEANEDEDLLPTHWAELPQAPRLH